MALISCASGGLSTSPDRAVARASSLAPPALHGPGAAGPEYRIGPSDVLEVSVFQAPDLSRSVEVDAHGDVALPLIGEIAASGETASDLAASIASKLQARYLQSPQVSVFVKEARSRKITVEGAVSQSGVFPLTGRTTLLQALAMAKGVDQYADLRHVIVFREVDSRRMAAVFDLAGIQNGRYADPEVFGDDVVVVNPSTGKKMFYNLVQSASLLALFRPY